MEDEMMRCEMDRPLRGNPIAGTGNIADLFIAFSSNSWASIAPLPLSLLWRPSSRRVRAQAASSAIDACFPRPSSAIVQLSAYQICLFCARTPAQFSWASSARILMHPLEVVAEQQDAEVNVED